MIDTHDPNDALDRLLALRPEDLDGWELDAAQNAEYRLEVEALDGLFEDVLQGWAGADLQAPDITADQILRLDRTPKTLPAAPAPRRSGPPVWLAPVAIAACLVLALATWQLRPEPTGLKSAVTATEATRITLQFAIERDVDGRVIVEPGRDGARLDSHDSIAMRLNVAGTGGYVSLFEVSNNGSQKLYPLDSAPLRLDAGTRRLQSAGGDDLVYRPDAAGTYQYVAVVTDEPIDATMILQDVIEAGETRPDLWPRHVLSVDGFTATWND
jgi:hypothetical protein